MATDADADGDVLRVMDGEAAPADLAADEATVERCYRLQVLARTFDEKAVNLHRQGRIGTYAPLAGQEATQVGAASALVDGDWLFPTYRDHAMYLTRGYDLEHVVAYLQGRGNVVDHADGEGRTFPPTIPIATQLPHAVGVGMAADYERGRASGGAVDPADADDAAPDGDPPAVLASFGDGATSEGDFHEAMNFAGVFEAPVVFLCQNNGYAISTPVERQTASPDIACKARAYGFEGLRVDGDDVLAVRRAVEAALDRAREGGGPTLIEAVTYRRGAHTTTDDPTRYRDEGEADAHPDPVEATREHLERAHGWTDDDEAAVREWATERVAEAIAAAEAAPEIDPDRMFDHVYAEVPERLARQRSTVPEDPEVDR